MSYFLRINIAQQAAQVGYETVSHQAVFIKNNVFYGLIINTAVLVTLLNANFEGAPVIGWIFDGKYSDYTPEWFEDVGNIITQAIFLKFAWHFLEYFYFLIKRSCKRIQDKGLKGRNDYNSLVTKKKTVQQYIDTYSGPQFPIHFKYSLVLNIIFVVFIYAPGIPFLFPLALLCMFVFYVFERLLVTYSFRAPP